uniref:MYND-type domain-containing protein n=1 Tax=Hyaloperonospora arabidopsidis (strain Emoy2) TaxID=559515 RepID=M4C1A8_HYAAE
MAGAAAEPSTASIPEESVLSPTEYLTRFWRAHASVFMRWFLSLPCVGQVSLLRNASPDIPQSYDLKETRPQATQLLTPELTLCALLEENGKAFLRLMNARATKMDQCSRHDVLYLISLRANGTMPTFSGDTLKHVSLAFIDLADPEHNVQSLMPSASSEIVEEKQALIKQGKLMEADVWLTLQVRQQIILTLLTNVAHTFESMFLKQGMGSDVNAAKTGCRYCGSEKKDSAGDETTRLLQCACEAAFYCCKEHQVEDWMNHKTSCKTIRKEKVAAVQSSVRQEAH